MLSKKKVEKILILHDQGLSMRKIAKRLKISKNTALRYIQLERYSIEIPHIHRTRDAEFHTNIETNNIVGEYFPIKRYEPHGSISFQGMSSHELQNTYNPIPHCYKYTCELPHVEEEILFDHSSREPNYNEDMNYGYQHVESHMPDLSAKQTKHETPEKSIQMIKKERNEQKKKQELQILSQKLDIIREYRRADLEFEKELNRIREQNLANDQNRKKELDNLKKLSKTNQDNKIENLEEQKNCTNNERAYEDNIANIIEQDDEKSKLLDTDEKIILVAEIFKGFSPIIGNIIGNNIYNFIYKNTPKKVTLIPAKQVNLVPAKQVNLVPAKQVNLVPAKQVNLIPAKEVNLREVKKEKK